LIDRNVSAEKCARRDIVAHAHIFKNAGTTLDWILEQNFGTDFTDDRNDQRMVREPQYLLDTVKSNPELRAISSHSMPLPIVEDDQINFHTIVMLRHPLLRVRSVYQFERKQRAATPGATMAKKLSFKDYVDWRMRASVASTIRDMQVRYLTRNSNKDREVLTEEHFMSACQFVDGNSLIGLVERFDQSMLLFSKYLASIGVDMNFSYQKQNVSNTPKAGKTQQIDSLKDDLGASLYQTLVEKNSMDLRLYEYFDQLLTKRFDALGNVQDELEILKRSVK
jgi:hypothetical protein